MPHKDPEKRKAYRTAYYRRNQEKFLAYHADYYEKNKKEINALRRAVRGLDKESANEKRREARAANREKAQVQDREYYARNREHKLAVKREAARRTKGLRSQQWIVKKYGLALPDYEAMLIAQEGKCAICKKPPEGKTRWGKLLIDHDHETGAVRGLLCSHCNTALGYMEDDPHILVAAAKYVMDSGKGVDANASSDFGACL